MKRHLTDRDLGSGSDDYLFAAITEFGVNVPDTGKVLRDLEERKARANQPPFVFENKVIATLGTAGFVEIALFNHYFRFVEVAGSSAQAFRRSVGVRCLFGDELPKDRQGYVKSVVDLMEDDDDRPLVAIIYLKVAPIVALCVPSLHREKESFIKSAPRWILTKLFGEGSTIWGKYDEILEATLEERVLEIPKIQAAPLLGLDTMEVVVVLRAACLEQIAAMVWLLRQHPLGDLLVKGGTWSESSLRKTEHRLAALLGGDVATEDLKSTPLFCGSTTTWGIPFDTVDKALQTVVNSERLIAHTSIVSVHLNDHPGSFDASQKQKFNHLAINGIPEVDVSRFTEEGKIGFWILLGQADRVSFPEGSRKAYPLRLLNILEHLKSVSGEGDLPRPEEGMTIKSLVAILICIRPGLNIPDSKLVSKYRDTLREKRNGHLDRSKKNPNSWTRRWLAVAKDRRLVYSFTNGMVNVINVILDHLDYDLEGFADLLPVLSAFVEVTENKPGRRELKPDDIIWASRVVENVAASRGRRGHPLQLPDDSLAFEGNAGYVLPREAFSVFAEALVEQIDPGSLLVVRDTVSGGVSSAISHFSWDVLRFSALSLHHPVHWLVAHELGHGRMKHVSIGYLKGHDDDLKSAFDEIRDRLQRDHPQLELPDEQNLDDFCRTVRHWLEDRRRSVEACKAISICLDEVMADLFLLESLRLPSDDLPAATRRFWFVWGPGIVITSGYDYGPRVPEVVMIRATILRMIFIDLIVTRLRDCEGGIVAEEGKEASDWMRHVGKVLDRLDSEAFLDSEDPPVEKGMEILVNIRHILNGLKISIEWAQIISPLSRSWGRLGEEEDVARTVEAWLVIANHCCKSLWADKVDEQSVHIKELYERYVYIKELYARYIEKLRDRWCGDGRPWLKLIDGHDMTAEAVGAYVSRRGGVFVKGSGNGTASHLEHREYQKMTNELVEELAECSRESRYEKVKKYLRE